MYIPPPKDNQSSSVAKGRRQAAPQSAKQRTDGCLKWPNPKAAGQPSPLYWRAINIRKIIRVDHGGRLPDGEAGQDLLRVLVDAAWFGCSEPVLWLEREASRIGASWDDVSAMIDEVEAGAKVCDRPFTKREAGQEIGLTYQQQVRTKAWQIAPTDKTDRQLARLKLKRGAAAAKAYRARCRADRAELAQTKPRAAMVKELMAAHGISRRTAYRWIAAGGAVRVPLTESKPWIAAGFNCRKTWERHRKRVADGGTSPVICPTGRTSENRLQHVDANDVSLIENEAVSQLWHKRRHRHSFLETNNSRSRGGTAKRLPTRHRRQQRRPCRREIVE